MSNLRSRFVVLFLAAVALATGSSVSLYSQGGVGQIVGTITDPSGAVVAGASIIARDTATSVQTEVKSNTEGAYRFAGLPIGIYTLTVRAVGFKTSERSEVRVVSGETWTLDVVLPLGQTNQTVEVSGKEVVVETTTSQAGNTRVSEEISELPLLMVGSERSAVSLLRTLPGVNSTPGLQSDAGHGMVHWPYGGVTTATINGAPQGGTSYSVDGVLASAGAAEQLRDDFSPPPEMIEEIRLNATNIPEYGWNSGVGVTMVEKSGTNLIHGSGYEYVRNDALNARNFLASKVSVEKQNEWGFVVGGPVYIPHVYDGRNKTFFFGSYGGYRYRTATGGALFSVPTANMRAGDFSEILGAQMGTDSLGRPVYQNELYDPTSTRSDGAGGFVRDPFMYGGKLNAIDPSRLSSIAKVYQSGLPLPTRSGYLYNFIGTMHESFLDSHKYSWKIDENVGTRHRFTFASEQWWQNNFAGNDPFSAIIAGDSQTLSHAYHYRLLYTGILSPNLVFSFRTGVNRMIDNATVPQAALNGATAAGLTGTVGAITPYIYLGPCCLTNGYEPMGASSGISKSPLWTVPVNTDLTWMKGKHSIKFGAAYVNNNEYYINTGSSGSFSFINYETGLPGSSAALTGWNYASFLLGSVDAYGESAPSVQKFQDEVFGFYAQDSWRVTPRLTLNYGMRWDIFIQAHESQNRIGLFDPTVANPAAGGILGGDTFYGDGPGRNGRHAIADPSLGNVNPSFGFAYLINPKTVIRGSYGLASANYESALVTLPIIPNTGWGASVNEISLDQGVTPLFSNWDAGIPAGFIPPLPTLNPSILNGSSDLYLNPHDMHPARVQNINFGVEREVPGGFLLKAAYVANLSHGITYLGGWNLDRMDPNDLSLGNLLNQNITSPEAQAAGIKSPYAGFSGPVWQALVQYPQYTSVQTIAPTGWSEYNSGQFTLQKRASHGLSFMASYTISKMFSNVTGSSWGPNQDIGLSIQPAAGVQLVGRSPKLLSEDDRPQILNLSYSYELPFGPGKRFANSSNPIVKQAVGGWRVNAIQSYISGAPVVVYGGTSVPGNLTEGGGVWAVRNSGAPVSTGVSCSSYDPNNPSRNRVINSSAFTNAAPFTFGNTSTLGDVRMCGYLGESVSAQKVFQLTERIHLLFSGDINNIFNRHNWSRLSSSTGAPGSFGEYRIASDPRLVQLHAKLEW